MYCFVDAEANLYCVVKADKINTVKCYVIVFSLINFILKFNHYQDTLQAGSIIKLCIVINIDIDQYGKNYCDHVNHITNIC